MPRARKSRGLDWVAIRTAYVQEGLSLRQIASLDRLGKPSLRQLSRRSSDEGWVEQRKQHGRAVSTAADARDIDWKADYLSKGRKAAATNAIVLAAAIQAKLKGVGELAGLKDYDVSKLTPRQLMDLANTNDTALKSLCAAVGVDPVAATSDGVDLPDEPLSDLEAGLTAAKPVPEREEDGDG